MKVPRVSERGTALVEFALVLPILALLFVIVIDLGLVLRDYQVLQDAAREGARFSALPKNWMDGQNPAATEQVIKQRVIDYLQQQRITVTAPNITIDQLFPIPMGTITGYGSKVTVSYTRSFLVGASLLPVGQLTLIGSAVYRNLY
ncbi:MAG TPA: TadE/TadG family type IV pilus assembly protein [Acidobacteriota bacterium]|jgi:Flp pilus assembly protein TadG